MNIGIRLHDTAGHSLEEHLRSAHEQGFTCVHIAMQKVIPGFAMLEAPTLLNEELAAQVRALLEKYELQCAVLGCYLNLATPDEEALAKNVACYKAHLRFARMIGALVTGTETGAPNTGYKTCPECWTEEALALCDGYVSLPALGCKNSINVGNAGAVVLFEALRQHGLGQGTTGGWPGVTRG